MLRSLIVKKSGYTSEVTYFNEWAELRVLPWVHLHPQGGEKNFFRRNLQEKCVSAPPRTRSDSPDRAGVNF